MSQIVPQEIVDAVSDADRAMPKFTQGLVQARTVDAAKRAATFALDGLEADMELYRDGALALPGARTPKRTPGHVVATIIMLKTYLSTLP